MSQPLQVFTAAAPGFFGLNTQGSGSSLGMGWATLLENTVFDDAGRISARKGQQEYTTVMNSEVKMLHEYVNEDGTRKLIAATATKIYDVTTSNPVDITPSTAPTAGNWRFVNFNRKVYGFQASHNVIMWDGAAGAFIDLNTEGGALFVPDGAIEGLSLGGRLWAILEVGNEFVVTYSDTLVDHDWDTSGSRNVAIDYLAWGNMGDVPVALTEWNGYLIVFGRDNILIYQNPYDPTGADFARVEMIEGVGCIGKHTIQKVGDDVVFLSDRGVFSLKRVIQEKSTPITDLTKNVRDSLMERVRSEERNASLEAVRSVYSPEEGFYLLSLPYENVSFCLDTKRPLEDGAWRVSTWNFGTAALARSLHDPANVAVYIEMGTKVGRHSSYLDNGSQYTVSYNGPWLEGGEQAAALLKIPKRVAFVAIGGDGQTVRVRLFADYNDLVPIWEDTTSRLSTANNSQWGSFKWGLDTWGVALDVNRNSVPSFGTGQVIMFGLQVPIIGQEFSFQKIDFHIKLGKIVT
jgi:hypothetical protein